MAKIKAFSIFLEQEVYNNLIKKAHAAGFNNKGAVSHYINKVATEPIAFIDEKFLEVLKKENDSL